MSFTLYVGIGELGNTLCFFQLRKFLKKIQLEEAKKSKMDVYEVFTFFFRYKCVEFQAHFFVNILNRQLQFVFQINQKYKKFSIELTSLAAAAISISTSSNLTSCSVTVPNDSRPLCVM